MADLKAQIEVTADASGVEAGVSQAKRSLKSLGDSARDAGKTADAGLSKIGESSKTAGAGLDKLGAAGKSAGAGLASAADAADKVGSAERSIVNAIQRTTAAMEAGSRGSAEYYRALAAQRGVRAEAIAPYLAALEAATKKQKGLGDAAESTSRQMAMVGPQVTDMVTQIAGGQSIVLTAIQQGGQLKDMFGGIGGAASALGRFLLTLLNPLTVTAAVAGGLAYAFYTGREESKALAKALALTGNAAGVTEGQFNAMADGIARAANSTIGSSREALQQLVADGKLSGNALSAAGTAVQRWAAVTGEASAEVAKDFSTALKDPAAWAEAMNEKVRFLTADLYHQMRALQDVGQNSKAAELAFQALDAKLAAVNQNVGYLERAWSRLKQVGSLVLDVTLSWGRTKTPQQELEEIEAQLKKLDKPFDPSVFGGNAETRAQANELRARREVLQEIIRLQDHSAQTQREQTALDAAQLTWAKRVEESKVQQLKLAEALALANAQADKAGATPEERAQVLAAIRQQYAGVVDAERALANARLNAQLAGAKRLEEATAAGITRSTEMLEAQRNAGLVTEQQYYETRRLLAQQDGANQLAALEAEQANIQGQQLIAKDAQELARQRVEQATQVAAVEARIAAVRASTLSKVQLLDLQEQSALKQRSLALESARVAQEEYLASLQRSQQIELASAGIGAAARQRLQGEQQIRDRYLQQRQQTEAQRLQSEFAGTFDERARKQYEAQLQLIEQFQGKALASYSQYYAQRLEQERDWSLGAAEAFNDYLATVRNTAKQSQELFSSAFRGIEDSLVSMVTTGKANFASLRDAVIADIARMQIRQLMAGLGGSLLSGTLLSSVFGTTGTAAVASAMGGDSLDNFLSLNGNFAGRAIGGPVSAGSVYRINEGGDPEVASFGGRDYLLTGGESGTVRPASDNAGGVTFHNTYNIGSNVSRADLYAAVAAGNAQLKADILRSRNRGGAFAS